MNSAEMKIVSSQSPPAMQERRARFVPDRRASLALAPALPTECDAKSRKHVLTMLADILTKTPGATIALPRDFAELLHRELERLSGGLWDAQDVARFLSVHRNWVYLQAEAGSLPCIRIGGLLRFEPDAIRAISKGQQIKGGRVVAIPVARKQTERK